MNRLIWLLLFLASFPMTGWLTSKAFDAQGYQAAGIYWALTLCSIFFSPVAMYQAMFKMHRWRRRRY